ncbi:uncharacterized protein KD926_009046 [Aspergillus affinis]|uniref:uncharacterized protein n=1 Tax=Aspergillus affinis TaxID=1070780 RepID=UPI0022FE92E2|nr:uncharacterized protein KD926_009046 [Aspergillus affinis]KAI9039828.1 hypothetical protein KD926_009046 [Aspergillus affinis]
MYGVSLEKFFHSYDTKTVTRCRAGLGISAATVTDANAVEKITLSVMAQGHANFQIIQNQQSASWAIYGSPVTPTCEHYKRAFFFAVGASPVLTTVFAADCLAPLLHDNVFVQDTVSLLGGYYALNNPQLLSVSQPDKRSLFRSLQSLRKFVAAEFQPTEGKDRPLVVMICALLLSFVELLVDPSGQLWDFSVRQLYCFSAKHQELSSSHSPFGRSVSTLARILNALRAICRPQDPNVDVSGQLPFLGSTKFLLTKEGAPLTQCQGQLLDRLAQDLEMWAQLQWWAIGWKTQASLSKLQQSIVETYRIGSNVGGINIACIGSKFQRDMIACILWYSHQELGIFGNAMLTLYQSAIIEISQIFSDPCWLSLECELPIMPLQLSYEQAISALNHAESSLQHLHLESVIYAPVLYAIGMEMARKPDKYRILRFISNIERKGFAVTKQVILAIKKDWYLMNRNIKK